MGKTPENPLRKTLFYSVESDSRLSGQIKKPQSNNHFKNYINGLMKACHDAVHIIIKNLRTHNIFQTLNYCWRPVWYLKGIADHFSTGF